ncbi:DUF4430 domain-containing protein [Candidatus Dojkabacteria bacterium]|nr:DUF4430 domain-containing protein [Candidatus Dojkabacteria bacterium]
MGKLDKKQLLWGAVAGAITVLLMLVTYVVGIEKGKETSVLSESQNQGNYIDDKEVYIAVRSDCTDYDLRTEEDHMRKYCLNYIDGETAFSTLARLDQDSEEFSFDYDESDFGVFITSINNYHPDVKSKFWAFLVNGEMSMVGVSDHLVQDGDELGFRVEEVVF